MTSPLPADSELVRRAHGGDRAAFDELFRRHAQSSWRLAQAVTGDAAAATVAVSEAFVAVLDAMRRGTYAPTAPFRTHLFTATRHAAIDGLRRADRLQVATGDTPFGSLPERWRTVLWLTEVEGLRIKDAAATLALPPSAAAQVAVRARAGLRERLVQAHAQAADKRECYRTVGRSGAYVADRLDGRDVAMVDQHLAQCAACRSHVSDLEDPGDNLRAAALPFPLALGTSAAAAWEASLERAGPARWAWSGRFGPRADKVVGGAAAAVFALGVVAAAAFGDRSGNGGIPGGESALGSPPLLEQPATQPRVVVPPAVPVGPSSTRPTSTRPAPGRTAAPDGLGAGRGTVTTPPQGTPPTGGGGTTPPTPAPPDDPGPETPPPVVPGTIPPITITLPPITIPPITVPPLPLLPPLPPITIPPITIPPITLPPITLPPLPPLFP